MSRASKLLHIGDKGPDFTLPEATSGDPLSLHDLLGQPLMIVFGRGTW
jgi:peroxiredoxin